MSFFEAIMLACFGAAWPFSIYKSYKSKQNGAKSVVFLYVVLIGYLSGIAHKMTRNPDWVTSLYALNALMVSIDILLYHRNVKLRRIL